MIFYSASRTRSQKPLASARAPPVKRVQSGRKKLSKKSKSNQMESRASLKTSPPPPTPPSPQRSPSTSPSKARQPLTPPASPTPPSVTAFKTVRDNFTDLTNPLAYSGDSKKLMKQIKSFKYVTRCVSSCMSHKITVQRPREKKKKLPTSPCVC